MINKSLLQSKMVLKNVNDSDMAKACNMSLSTFSAKKNGHREFDLSEAESICHFLGITDNDEKAHIFLPGLSQ